MDKQLIRAKRRLGFKVALAMIPIAAAVVLIAAENPLVIRIQDQCDPATFNAAVGPGTCVGDGTITFAHFIAEVTAAHKVGAWHFDPADTSVAPGTVLTLNNRGGETHTFTKVRNFGGGLRCASERIIWQSGPCAGMRNSYPRWPRTQAA